MTANASIVGQEKLKLILVTPNADDRTDREMAINFSDTPLHVYQVASTVNINDRTKVFTLQFTTGEMIRNNNIRVAQAYEGELQKRLLQKSCVTQNF